MCAPQRVARAAPRAGGANGRGGARQSYVITNIRLVGVPNFDVGGGSDPYIHVKCDNVKVFDQKKRAKHVRARRQMGACVACVCE